MRHLFAVDADMAGDRIAQARDRLGKLGLAVAIDPGQPQDLARLDREADAGHRLDAAVALDPEILDLEQRPADGRGRALDVEHHVAPDHEPRELARAGGRGGELGDDAARAHHRHPVGDRHHLLELVGDEEDGLAAGLEAAQQIEEGIDLDRRQHARRLVQDENVGVAVEQLQDLDRCCMPIGRRQVGSAGSTSKPKDLLSSASLRRCPSRSSASPPPSSPSTTFSATVSGPTSMKC